MKLDTAALFSSLFRKRKSETFSAQLQEEAPQGRMRRQTRHRHRWGDVIPLAELQPGAKGIIVVVRGSRKVTQRLADLGFTPKTTVSVVKAVPLNGPIEVAVRGSRLAIGREIAQNILVQTKGL